MTVADRLELRELVDRYAQAVDRTDAAGVAALFVEDGTLATWLDPTSSEGTGQRQGRAAIAAAIRGMARYVATHHTVSSASVAVDGDTATGETRCAAHHLEDTPAGRRDTVLYIRYLDTFARDRDGWRFRRREVRVQWRSVVPVQA